MSLLDALLLEGHPLDVHVAYRQDGNKGSGSISDPWDGSTDARFDAVMASLPANIPVCVHLGPSPRDGSNQPIPFQTGGFWVLSNGTSGSAWQPRPGMSIVGSGMDVTYLQLKLPGSPTNGAHYFAIGAPTTSPVDYLNVSDMTIDCNLPSSAGVACGAVRVMGNHARVRQVKCINWGSRTTAQPGFVIALIIADPDSGAPLTRADDAGIEGCVALQPSANNNVSGAAVNVLHLGGRERSSAVLTQLGLGPFIRNCFVDCNSPTPSAPAPEYRALSMGACRGGVVECNQVHNTQYGGPYQENFNTRELIVRANLFRNVVKGPYLNLGTSSSIGVEKLLVERNTIELVAASVNSPVGPPIAIHVYDRNVVSAPPPYVHGQVVVRNNRIRYLDGASGSFNGYAIDVAGTNALIVSDNVVEVVPANPVRHVRCGTAKYFNNQTPDGVLILGWNAALDFRQGELATDAEDAFVLAFINNR